MCEFLMRHVTAYCHDGVHAFSSFIFTFIFFSFGILTVVNRKGLEEPPSDTQKTSPALGIYDTVSGTWAQGAGSRVTQLITARDIRENLSDAAIGGTTYRKVSRQE